MMEITDNNRDNNLEVKEIDYELILKMRCSIFGPQDQSREFFTLDTDLIDTTKHLGLFEKSSLVEQNGLPISIVSINFTNSGKELQFRYLGTQFQYQNKGYGSIMINHFIENVAKKSNCNRVWCNARSHKINFYIKNFNFIATNTTYRKNDVDFVILEKFI